MPQVPFVTSWENFDQVQGLASFQLLQGLATSSSNWVDTFLEFYFVTWISLVNFDWIAKHRLELWSREWVEHVSFEILMFSKDFDDVSVDVLLISRGFSKLTHVEFYCVKTWKTDWNKFPKKITRKTSLGDSLHSGFLQRCELELCACKLRKTLTEHQHLHWNIIKNSTG